MGCYEFDSEKLKSDIKVSQIKFNIYKKNFFDVYKHSEPQTSNMDVSKWNKNKKIYIFFPSFNSKGSLYYKLVRDKRKKWLRKEFSSSGIDTNNITFTSINQYSFDKIMPYCQESNSPTIGIFDIPL